MLPIFYSDIVFVDSVTDRDRKIQRGPSHMGFCKGTHLCPALAGEFIAAASELPIVFLLDQSQATPVFMLGLKPGQNLFVSETGVWTGTYLPRYLERYPFILANLEDSNMVLAVERQALGADEGEPLFLADGARAHALSQGLATAERYAKDAQISDGFLTRLRKLDLFQPISVQVDREGTSYGWSDLLVVDEAKLAALGDAELATLVRSGDLALIHAHLFSLRAFQGFQARLDRVPPIAPAA